MEIILIIIGIALIVLGNRNKDTNGQRTSSGTTMFRIGVAAVGIGALIFVISFVIAFNKSVNRNTNTTTTQTAGEKYPEQVRSNFINACVSGAGEESYRSNCECILENIENVYTIDQYIAFEKEQENTDVIPPEVQNAIDQCKN